MLLYTCSTYCVWVRRLVVSVGVMPSFGSTMCCMCWLPVENLPLLVASCSVGNIIKELAGSEAAGPSVIIGFLGPEDPLSSYTKRLLSASVPAGLDVLVTWPPDYSNATALRFASDLSTTELVTAFAADPSVNSLGPPSVPSSSVVITTTYAPPPPAQYSPPPPFSSPSGPNVAASPSATPATPSQIQVSITLTSRAFSVCFLLLLARMLKQSVSGCCLIICWSMPCRHRHVGE